MMQQEGNLKQCGSKLLKTIISKQGRQQKIFQEWPMEKRLKNSKKDRKIAILSLFQGGQWKKYQKIPKKNTEK